MEDAPLLGRDQNGDEAHVPPPGGWVAAAGIGVVALVVMLSSSGTDEPVAATTSSIPAVPTISIPPTLPEGEVVEETLRWGGVAGLEEALHLGGATEFGGSYWVAGSTRQGLTVWRSDDEDGGLWGVFSRLDDTTAWQVTDLEATEHHLIMAATGPGGSGSVFTSVGGRRWMEHHLPSTDPRRPVTSPREITPFPGGVVIQGFARSEMPVQDLLEGAAPAVVDLVESGAGNLTFTPEGMSVTVPPNLEIVDIPTSDFPEGFQPFIPPSTRVWRGESPSDLAPVRDETHPWRVELMGNGLLVGSLGNRLATSRDGHHWEPAGPVITGMTSFVPWEEGVAVATVDEGLRYWTPDSSGTSSVVPRGPVGQSARVHSPLAGQGWGLAVFAQTSSLHSIPKRTPISTTAEGELTLMPDSRLEFVREGEVVWSGTLPEVPVRLEEEQLLILGPEEQSVPVKVEDWLDAVFGFRRPTGGVRLLHTPDARSWSSSDWDEVMGGGRIGTPILLATEDFLIAVDQPSSRPFRDVNVATGRPLE